MNRIGTIIDNRYRIIEPLGEGGMSTVWKATDLTTHQNVVLKVMKERVTSSHIEDIIRFKREIEIVSKFDHPNIIKIYGSGEFENKPYIAMELLSGDNLVELLRSQIQFNDSEAVTIVKQITEALIYVHDNGVIHRDLKPSNIFIYQEQTKVKLLDFGMALVMELGAITGEREVIGTFGYMSPEATGILENQVDERSDLYSLGVIFYHLLTGTLPFQSDSVHQIIHRQVALQPPRPSKINPEIPAVLETMVFKLLQKDPDLRYQTARGLLADLERYQNGESQFEIGSKDQKIKLTYQTRLVGRENELASIKGLIAKAKSGQGSICFIKGEAGIGKTRLVEEIRSYIYEMDELFIAGRCINSSNKTPYQPFKDAIDDYLGKLDRAETPIKAVESERLKNLWADHKEIIIKFNPRLKKYMGAPEKRETLVTEWENNRFLRILADFFCNLSSPGRICVLFLDDLHWADEGSLNLLEELLRKIDSSSLFILGTYRDNEVHPEHGLAWIQRESQETGTALSEIKLEPLNHERMNQLIANLLGETVERARDLSGYILDKSGGNPFFTIQIFRELIENKAISWQEGYWQEDWEFLRKMPVSGTMLNTILRRIENLTTGQNDLLCKGAIIGREFEIELLYQLTDMNRETVVTLIDELIAQQLLERSLTKGKVLFVHDRIRDAFYDQIPETKRRQIHLQIAEAIERINDNLDEAVFDLAHHYAEGGDQEKTLQFMLPAADKAKESWANEEAIKYYKIVIDILESKKLRNSHFFYAQENLLQLYVTVGKYEDVITISEQLIPLTTTALTKAGLYKKIGIAFSHKGEWTQSRNYLIKGLELLSVKIPQNNIEVRVFYINELSKHFLLRLFPGLFSRKRSKPVKDEDKEIISLCNNLMWTYISSGHTNRLPWVVLRMLNISEIRIGKSIELGLSLIAYATFYMGIPKFNRAIKYNEKALSLNKEINNQWGIGISLLSLGLIYFFAGKNDESIKLYEQAQLILQKMGDLWQLKVGFNGLGFVHHFISSYDKSIDFLYQSLEISRKLKDFSGIGTALFFSAHNYIEKGDFLKAEELLAESQKICIENKMWIEYGASLICTGRLELERSNFNNAIKSLKQAIKINEENNLPDHYHIDHLSYFLADAHIKRSKENTQITKLEKKQIFHLCRKAIKETRSWPNHYGGALRVMANYYQLSGKNNQAEKYFLKSIEYDQKINRKYDLAKDYFEYGNFLESLKKNIEARECWQKAHEIFMNIGAEGYAQKTAILLKDNQNEMKSFDDLTAKDRLKFERRMNTVLTTSSYISSTLDIDELLQRVLDSALELLGAETGLLLLYPEEGAKHLEVRVSRKISMEEYHRQGFAPSRSIIARVEKEKTSLIITDAMADEMLKNQSSVVMSGIRSVICAPVMNKDQLLGVIYLDHSLLGGLFSEEDLKILDSISSQAGVSIENARLYSKLKDYSREIQESHNKIAQWNQELEACVLERTSQLNEKNTKLEAINTELVTANEELAAANKQIQEYAAKIEELTLEKERTRFARDAHDSLGRTMTLSLSLLEACDATSDKNPATAKEHLGEAIKMTRKGLKELRNSIYDLTATKLTANNLTNALEDLILEYRVSGMNVDFHIDGESNCQDPRYFDVVYRVCQEALTNSLRHGKAQNVSIIIRLTNHRITTSILDDGCGCNTIQKGLGLTSMEQRVKSVNGDIIFGPDGLKGFNINFELPLGETV